MEVLLLFFTAALQAQLLLEKRFIAYEGYDMHPENDSIILDPADWHEACDPWKTGSEVMDVHYEDLTLHPTRSKEDTYVCPPEMRSPSGCGDFMNDPRGMECPDGGVFDTMTGTTETKSATAVCSDQRIVANDPDKMWQFHVCVQHPIYYTYKSTSDGAKWPLSTGRHRERWPKWGEYDFLPEQRWLHAVEHGGFAFLYNPCMIVQEDLCKLRNFIYGLNKYFVNDYRFRKLGEDREDMTDFRFVLTPYKDLRKEFAIVAFNGIYFSKCWNVPGMLNFIKEHYREAWEDWPPSGAYDYLWKDYATQSECTVSDKKAKEIYDPFGGFPENNFNVGPPGYRWTACVEKDTKPIQGYATAFKGTPEDCYLQCSEGIPKKEGKFRKCKYWTYNPEKERCMLYGKIKEGMEEAPMIYGAKTDCHPYNMNYKAEA